MRPVALQQQQKQQRALLEPSKKAPATTTTRASKKSPSPHHLAVGSGVVCSAHRRRLQSSPRPLLSPVPRRFSSAVRAEASGEGDAAAPSSSSSAEAPRDDDVLPDSLSDALAQAGAATADALASGGPGARALVELLLPDLWDPASGAVFAEEGDQQRFWKLTRRYAEELVASSPAGTRVRALYPDAGVAAMLKSQWGGGDKGLAFDVAAITDREPARAGTDDVVVLAAPDPQSLAAAVRAADAARDAGIPCVMFNPRLVSGDVGIGLNVRRLRDGFLSTFATAYALRPVGEVGTVYKRWPGKWQVFVEDESAPGRYKLAGNGEGFDAAPAGEALDLIFSQALSSSSSSSSSSWSGGPRVDPTDDSQIVGIGERVGSVVRGLQRFMKQLSQ